MNWELIPTAPGWQLVHEGRVLATIAWNRDRDEYVNSAGAGMGRAFDEAKRKAEQLVAPKRRSA